MKKVVVAVLGILFLINCFSSQSVKRYFQLSLPVTVTSDLERINKVLLIETVVADDLYDDFRLIYRKSPYQINYYAYDFWVEKPAVLLKNALTQFFSHVGIFDQVGDTLSQVEPDIILKSRLVSIEELDLDTAWFARLSMELDFCDFKSGKSIFYYRFDRKKSLPGKDVTQLPRVISSILQLELTALIQPLHHKIRMFHGDQ